MERNQRKYAISPVPLPSAKLNRLSTLQGTNSQQSSFGQFKFHTIEGNSVKACALTHSKSSNLTNSVDECKTPESIEVVVEDKMFELWTSIEYVKSKQILTNESVKEAIGKYI